MTANLQSDIWDKFKGNVIISCQATKGTPIDRPDFIAAQALTVEQAGAKAIRAEGIANILAIKKVVSVPVIGLIKEFNPDFPVYITPTIEHVLALEEAGADVIAVDATQGRRRGSESLQEFYMKIKERTNIPLLADIDKLENALKAESLGFEAIASTLSGYTNGDDVPLGPDLDLVSALKMNTNSKVFAEGRYSSAEEINQAFLNGAWSVCVGTLITNPYLSTKNLLAKINSSQPAY